jgi:hypothetical protein
MRRFFLLSAACLAAGLLLAACAAQTVDVPTPPDLSALVRSFEHPSLPFDATTVDSIVKKKDAVFNLLDGLDELKPVLDALGALGGSTGTDTSGQALGPGVEVEVRGGGLTAGGVTVEGQGYLVLTRVCPGWEASATTDPSVGGTVSLTAVFSDEGFNAVVWGEARTCRYAYGGHLLQLDGTVHLDTGGLLMGEEQGVQVLLEFAGTAKVDDQAYSADVSFRIAVSSERVEINLDLGDGNVLFYAQQTDQGFVASNGSWTCDFGVGSCSNGTDTVALW